MQSSIVAGSNSLPGTFVANLDRAAEYANAEKAVATRRAYSSDFGIFQAWAFANAQNALPASPESVAAFVASEAAKGVRPSTIGRRIAAIQYAHKLRGLTTPTDDERVKATVRGIRRTYGTAPVKKAPATSERIIAMAATGEGITALRDRALLLLGFAGAFRRSELVALDVADIEVVAEGLRVTIRRGKTDQEGQGATIAIVPGAVACPVAAFRAWLDASGITEGAVFRSIQKGGKVQERLTAKSVAVIVKQRAALVGLDAKAYAGHSLRAGFLTSAAKRGASVFKMMDTSRHRSVETLRGYVRDAELFKDHAGAGLL